MVIIEIRTHVCTILSTHLYHQFEIERLLFGDIHMTVCGTGGMGNLYQLPLTKKMCLPLRTI